MLIFSCCKIKIEQFLITHAKILSNIDISYIKFSFNENNIKLIMIKFSFMANFTFYRYIYEVINNCRVWTY